MTLKLLNYYAAKPQRMQAKSAPLKSKAVGHGVNQVKTGVYRPAYKPWG